MAVVTGTAVTLKMMGKALLKSLAKKATMATVKKAVKGKAKDFVKDKIKDKIKSKFKKKKVKGKDIARKMLGGGEEGGGATFGSMGGAIVPSPAGQLVPTGEVSIVKAKPVSKEASELGLIPFMTSLDTVKGSVDKINESLNNNLKDAKKRVEKQRLLNAREKKKDREAALESTMLGRILKRPVDAAKDAADNFLSKLLKFFLYTTLGVLVNALMGGARDIIKIFILGFKAITMAWPTVKNFFKGLFGVVGNVFKAIKNAIGSIAKSVINVFKKVGATIFNWIKNAIQVVGKAIKNFIKGAWNFVKNPLKSTGKIIQSVKNSPIGKAIGGGLKKVTNFLKSPIKNAKNVVKNLKKTKLAKNIGKGIKNIRNVVKDPAKALKNLKKTKLAKNIGKAIKDPAKALKNLKKTNLAKNIGKGIKNIKQSGIGKTIGKGIKNIQQSGIGKGLNNVFKNVSQKTTSLVKGVQGKKGSDLLKGAGKKIETVAKGGWFKGIKNWVGNAWKQGAKWAKQIGDIAKLVTQPAKLMEMVKKTMSGKVTKLVEKNKTVAKLLEMVKNPKKLSSGIKSFLENAKKSKGLTNLRGALGKAAKLKIAGIDAVLAAIMGLIDYVAFGEAPINAILRATGALVGYTAGFAIGAPFGGVPGFITGMAGGWVGEKAADVISAGLASLPGIKDLKDPIMDDGRPMVRNPFSAEVQGERAEQVKEYGKVEKQEEALFGDKDVQDKSREIASSTSYEDGEGESTVIINQGSESTAASGGGKAGKPGFIRLPVDDLTIVNSQYEMLTKSKTYKS